MNSMTPAQIIRAICIVLGLAAGMAAANLMLHRETLLGIKVGWIVALLLIIAVAPEKLPFFSGDAGVCLFFRNAFGIVFAILFLVILFVVFWIQLPQEQVPRFDGKVVELMNSQGLGIPRVEFQDAAGSQHTFDDALATVIFPKHIFVVGERVVIRAPTTSPPHVDHSVLDRKSVV